MINVPKGTKDMLPKEAAKWHFVENTARAVAASFGFREIRTPTFEATELFLRGVGETTDVVNKEMYTFLDKGDRSMTLKPEGTAGVARAYIENGMGSLPTPQKMYYITPVFRYERPQSGRLREHHQFGIELYGSETPAADAEVISVAKTVLEKTGVANLKLKINSIGCPECRKRYNAALKEFFAARIDGMCDTCKERLNKNPLRILDCKEEQCKKINAEAPSVLDYLCDDCRSHHEELKTILKAVGTEFSEDCRIVRGLDYYTRTVFEFTTETIGAQGTVCGGGRYNGLVSSVGGAYTPAVGFGMGIERLIMVAEAAGVRLGTEEVPDLYIASLGNAAEAFRLAGELRKKGLSVETDVMNRSLKAQLKYASKIGARYSVVLGDDEIEKGVCELKKMDDGTVVSVSLADIASRINQAADNRPNIRQ